MNRALLATLLVALSLVGTASAGPVHTGSPVAPQVDDGVGDVEMLGLGGPVRSGVAQQGVDVSSALSVERSGTEAQIDRRALRASFERTESEQARREFLFEAATDVEIAISQLKAEQRAARLGYLNESIGVDEYLRSRAVFAARARQRQADLDAIGSLAEDVPGLSMRSRLESLRVSLTGADAPVSTRLSDVATGAADPTAVYVAVSGDGRVLAMVTGEQYVREAYRADLWTPDSTGGIGFDEAVSRANQLYPVAFNSSRNIARGVSEHGAGTYEVSMEVNEGTIFTYLDADTRNVFYEVRRFRLASIQPAAPVIATANGTRLAVNGTYDGGPLRIVATTNATGDPADVTVRVGPVAYRTGDDGAVWAVAPARPTQVTAVGETGNVSVTVDPFPPTLVEVSEPTG